MSTEKTQDKKRTLEEWVYIVQCPAGLESVTVKELNERCSGFELLWQGLSCVKFISTSHIRSLIGLGILIAR